MKDSDSVFHSSFSFTNDAPRPLPTAEELRQALAASEKSDTRQIISSLFDEATFVEIGTYTKKSFSEYAYTGQLNDFEGVICGYGAINGQLVYAFAQDVSRMNGAMDDTHANKILSLYQMAMRNAAPVIGIFNSVGADIYEGVSSMAAYGKIMRAVAEASGFIPQIAIVAGDCTGIASPLAACFDFVVAVEGASFYVRSPDFSGANESNETVAALTVPDALSAVKEVRVLLSYIPANAEEGIRPVPCADSLNRLLGDQSFDHNLHNMLSAVADNGIYKEIYTDTAPTFLTAFTCIGGVRCAVCGHTIQNGEAMFNGLEARKAARFVSFCDAFSIPLVTFVDTAGFAYSKKKENTSFVLSLSSLAFAYAKSQMPKISIIVGRAIGGAYTLLGSKALSADVVYALDSAEIGALATDAAVAFAWNDRVTLSRTREELENEWRVSLASPVAAACKGEVDDIITVSEIRQRICSALLMLSAKGTASKKRHGILPL
ncbi:MAG: hypothetical protein J6K61_06080 [Clostridia bacterium]|nr:hypothetical protein [Clostridia bacterium]